MMRNFVLVLSGFVILLGGCRKGGNPKPRYPKVTTIAEGRVLKKYTHKPVANCTITLQGRKPYESTGLCLFCPDSTYFDIASTTTDANGYYHLEGSTEENISS